MLRNGGSWQNLSAVGTKLNNWAATDLPKIQELHREVSLRRQGLYSTNKPRLQPFGLVPLVTFWHRAAYLACTRSHAPAA